MVSILKFLSFSFVVFSSIISFKEPISLQLIFPGVSQINVWWKFLSNFKQEMDTSFPIKNIKVKK